MGVYEALNADSPEMQEAKLATRHRYEEAWELFAHGDYASAEILFQECLAKNPDDMAARLHVERCQRSLKLNASEAPEAQGG